MRGLQSVVLCLALAVGLAAARPAHHSMGAVHRFEPAAGYEANFVSFANGITVDTRTGEPALPSGLTLEPSAEESQYYVIQFNGPFLRQWFRQLENSGIRTFGYLPHYAVLAELTPEQVEHVASLPMVRWTGLYQPAYKLESGLLSASGPHKVVILSLPFEDPSPVHAAIAELGGTVVEAMSSSFGTTITAELDGSDIAALARLNQVYWIQAWSEGSFCNNTSQWVMQGGWQSSSPPDTSLAARPVWRNGVRGQRVILSATDTGLNTGHNMFRDPAMSVTPPGIWPDHRKVVAYKRFEGADASEGQYHGSHVAGSVCGNDSITGGTSYYDGMAIDARYYFVDITNGYSFLVPNDHTPLWDTVYAGRGLPDSLRPIKQQSGSWGWSNSSGTYLIQDASTDVFCYAHPDYLNIMAAGNESSARRLRNPGISKNSLTVGATERGIRSNTIASFSSRGPTQDNRIKPNVMAPGVDIMSAQRTGTNGYSEMSGTSMATPTASGAIGLMRCYLQEGYYPTGTPEPGNRISYISAALLRSMAMASADPNVGSYTIPSFDIGWGRIDADSLLYFAGDLRKLIICDDTAGLRTGEYKEQQFHVSSAIPLRVSLAWTDTAAAPSANPTLVNDLDLTLTSPGGTVYKGNKYTGGQSTPNPTGRDSNNVEECARVNLPDTGTWTIRVSAFNVATARKQGFAWTMCGDVEPIAVQIHDVGPTAILAPTDTVDTGTTVTPSAVVRNFGAFEETFLTRLSIGSDYSDTVTITLPAGASDTLTFTAWTAGPAGTYAVRCSTGLPGDDNTANNLLEDSVTVYPLTGIVEGKGLPVAFALEQVLPNPASGRISTRFALPRPGHVRLSLYSSTGSLVKLLHSGALPAGHHTINGKLQTANWQLLPAGIYLVRLETGSFSATRKLVVQR